VTTIRGVLIEKIADAHNATHVIASDGKSEMRRTAKLMIALCRTSNIVSLDWLVKSAAEARALPCKDYLILDNEKVEQQYKFTMRHTLTNLTRRLEQGTYLLDGWSVFVCTGVAGNKAPPEEEFRLVVEAAGASWLTSPASRGLVHSKILIITSDPETKKQLSPKPVATALKNGATKRTTTWLFNAIMAQEADL
jgi:hypothetical protein